MNALQITLHGLGETSLLASLLIAVFLSLRPLLRRAVGSQWLCVLWLAILARLLMPWAVESRWSVFNRWQARTAAVPAAAQEAVKIKVNVVDDAGFKPGAGVATSAPEQAATRAWRTPAMGDVLNILWLSGFACGLCVLAWRWNQTRRLGARTRPATNGRLLHIFASIPEKWRRNVEMRTTNAVQVPTLAGIIRPQIWMPREWPGKFSDAELRNVLMHELGHARRGDLVVQWLFAIAQCAHWFNPLVWIAARAARLDREMACDAWVLARSGADSGGYGAALVKAVELLREPLRAAPAGVAMASSRRSLSARISGIGAFRPMPAWRGLLGIIAMLVALATVTTSCKKGAPAASGPAAAQSSATAGFPQQALSSPSAKEKSTAGEAGFQIKVECKLIAIPEATLKKNFPDDGKPIIDPFSGLRTGNAPGEDGDLRFLYLKFPELRKEKPSDDDFLKQLISRKIADSPWEVIGVATKVQYQAILKSLENSAVGHVLAAPTVITKNSQQAVIKSGGRKIRYPSAYGPDKTSPTGVTATEFTTFEEGWTLRVKPEIGADQTISLGLARESKDFYGFVPVDSATLLSEDQIDNTHVVSQCSLASSWKSDLQIWNGMTVLIGNIHLKVTKNKSGGPGIYREIMLFAITAHIVDADNAGQSSPPSAPALREVSELPHGIAIKGKPGFAISPYTLNAGRSIYIDF